MLAADEDREDAVGLADLSRNELEIVAQDHDLREVDPGHAEPLGERAELIEVVHVVRPRRVPLRRPARRVRAW